MYQVFKEEYYKLYDATVDEFIDYFYSMDELIDFIARWYKYSYFFDESCHYRKVLINLFLEKYTCDVNQLMTIGKGNLPKCFIIYSNIGRIINAHDFADEALKRWTNKGKKISDWSIYDSWRRHRPKHKYLKWYRTRHTYEYRKDPVPYTRKHRGGSWWSMPRTARLIRMYKNPEYKDFNRGTMKGIPIWWDDKIRRTQKSWKEQTKNRYQWQKKAKNNKKFLGEM